MAFEYKVITYNSSYIYASDEELEGKLDSLGSSGWELVSAVPEVKGSGTEGEVEIKTTDIKFIFKREI